MTLTSYAIAATAHMLGKTPDEILSPSVDRLPPVQDLAKDIVAKHSLLNYVLSGYSYEDKTLEHSNELITLLLLWFHYRDITREGDGQRLLKLMPILLLIFTTFKRKNYSREVAILLLQYNYLLSPRMKQQLLYSRFINTHSVKGKNIPCDLHMEHLNR